MRWLIALMLLADPAHADEAIEIEKQVWPDRGVTGSVFVGADSGTRTGVGVVAGAEGHLGDSSDGCNFVATGGTGALRIGPVPASLEHQASACVGVRLIDEGIDITILPLSIEHRLVFAGVPKLSARRITWSEPYTHEQLDLGGHLATVRTGEGWSILAMPITGHLDWLYQPLDDDRLYQTRHGLSAFMVAARQDRTGGLLQIFGGHFEGPWWRIDLVTADDIQLGSSPLLLDISLGSAETSDYVEGMHVGASGLTGRFGLGLLLGPFTASASIDRDFYQTIDEAIIVDTRAEASLALARGRWSARASAFRSATQLVSIDGREPMELDPTYGVELALAMPVGRHLDARIGAAWARSFYSRLASDAPMVAPGVELTAQLVASFGR